MVGSTNFSNKRNFVKHFKFFRQDGLGDSLNIQGLLKACERMSESKTGALLIFERTNSLEFVKESGDKMNIEVTQPIIESIFYKNSPLHDGAAIICDNYIVATRVILPVGNDRKIPLKYGLRHRAALSISEKTDALALVVSEETGKISYIKNGDFVTFKDITELSEIMQEDLV